MKSVFVHAVLLAVALPVAYATWTREEVVGANDRAVPLWEEDRDDIVSVTFRDRRKVLVIQPRNDDGEYLWGIRSYTQLGKDSVPPGPYALPDSVEFQVGKEDGEQLWGLLSSPMALRDLGSLNDSLATVYGFTADTARMQVVFPGMSRDILIGGSVFGSGDRYVTQSGSDHVYVLPGGVLTLLMGADETLTDRRLHTFTRDQVASLTLTTPKGKLDYVSVGQLGSTIQWAKPDSTDRPDVRLSNLMGQLDESGFTTYRADLDPSQMKQLLRAEYLAADGEVLGFLEFYERPGPQGTTEHFFRTEHTRVPVQTYEEMASMINSNLDQMF